MTPQNIIPQNAAPLAPQPSADPLAQSLAQLRDIHLPAEISPWPPAPGWWLLAIITIATMVYGTYFWLRHRRNNHYRRLALQQLASVEKLLPSGSIYLPALNQLLKQTVLAAPKPAPVAGLTGHSWLMFLDHSGNTNAFSNGPGQLLLNGPYAPAITMNTEQQQHLQTLHSLAKQWIQSHRLDGAMPPC